MLWRVPQTQLSEQARRHYKQAPSMGGGNPGGGGNGFKMDGPSAGPKGEQGKPQGMASKAIDKGLDKAAKAGKGNVAGEALGVASKLKQAKHTAETKGKGAAAADVAAAGVRTAAVAAATATGVGAPIAQAVVKGWDGAKKALGFVGIKLEDRYVLYAGAIAILMPIILLAFVAFVALFYWEHPTQSLSLAFQAAKYRLGFATNTIIDTGAASRLAYETPVKDGTAIAASASNPGDLGEPLPGTYAYKLSKIDWEKAKYQTLSTETNCIITTEEVRAPDGTTRSVVSKVSLKSNPDKGIEGIAKANCLNSSYPIFNTVMRSKYIRDNLNKQIGIRYAYAIPEESKDFDGKDDEQVSTILRNKTLGRIWQRTGGVSGYSDTLPQGDATPSEICANDPNKFSCLLANVFGSVIYAYRAGPEVSQVAADCANNYNFNVTKNIDSAIEKSKHDLKCGITPNQLKFMFNVPTEKEIASADERKSTAAKVTALKTMCEIYSRTQENEPVAIERYKKYVKDRISSEATAAFQAMTYAHTNRERFLNIRELGGDSYKIYGMGTAQEYNYSVNDQVAGSPTDSDAVSRILGLPNASKNVYNDDSIQKAQDILAKLSVNGKTTLWNKLFNTSKPLCADVLQEDSFDRVSALINSPTTDEATLTDFRRVASQYDAFYPSYKKAIATLDYYSQDKKGGQIEINEAAKSVRLEDLLVSLIRIESNAATAGNEPGTQNYNRMGVGARAYNIALSIAMGGSFQTANQAVTKENEDRTTIAYEDSVRGPLWRIFDNSNPRSFTSRFNVAFIDKPDRVIGNVLAVVGNFFNPLKNMVGTPNSLAYALSGQSNVAQAASSYEINSLRLDPAGIPEGFSTDINPIDNANRIENVADSNLKAFGLFQQWDSCMKESIPSRFHLLNPSPEKKDLYEQYCQPLLDVTALTQLNETQKGIAAIIGAAPGRVNFDDQQNRLVLSFMYRAYHFYNLQADAMAYLSNPDEEDKDYNAEAVQAAPGLAPNTGGVAPTGAAGDTSTTPCPVGTNDGGIATKYGPDKVAEHNLRLCNVQGITVNVSVAANLNNLLTNAQAAGVQLSGSGFRTFDGQVKLRTKNKCPNEFTAPASSCGTPTAIPGTSNHENGEAIDFTQGGSTLRSGSSGFNWLRANAATYGFKNLPSESWHWSVDGS